MSCIADCDTVQIVEPKTDLLVDTAGGSSDVDERGEVELSAGQTSVVVLFTVPKLNANFNFEYLYVEAMGKPNAGTVLPIATIRAVEGFACVLAGSPVEAGYVLKWRVTIVRSSSLVQVDAPEDLYVQIPRATQMAVTFVNPRSGVNYGFTELRVENLHDPPATQAIIRVQVYAKSISGFNVAINPRPRTDYYFLKVRTP